VLRRLLGFVGIVLGYSCYYLTRNSLTYTAPVMVADAALNMDITQVRPRCSRFVCEGRQCAIEHEHHEHEHRAHVSQHHPSGQCFSNMHRG